jgi:hypothetical protein
VVAASVVVTVHEISTARRSNEIPDLRFMNVIPFTAFIGGSHLATVAPRKNINRQNTACKQARRDLEGYGYVDNE